MKRYGVACLLALQIATAPASLNITMPAVGECNVNDTVPRLTSTAQNINPAVLKLALTAYNCAVKAGMDKQQVLSIIDYTLPSTQKRLWVFDIVHNRALFNSFVAHGKGSGDVTAERFSNQPETHASSIGLFLTGDVYKGHNGYSLKLYGLEKGFNDKAESRNIVMHGAWYVSQEKANSGQLGRSWGCPAVPQQLVTPIINSIKKGSLIFAYYPDNVWLKQSQYLHCTGSLGGQMPPVPPLNNTV